MNIIQYVLKYGDKTFAERPLNEVDSLIFSELSYLNFTGVVRYAPPKQTLKELCALSDKLIFDTLLPESNKKLLDAISKSPRFENVSVGYFHEHNDEKREIRFAAVTFLWEGGAYVAFRGTDVTLLGWKEDFNMAFRESIPSQDMALDYLLDIAGKETCPLYAGGHSKGGNLVLYAAVHAPEEVQERLISVFNHDGPGFRESIFDTPEFLRIADRVQKTVPHDSLIGILLFHSDNYKVVVSRSVLIGQHNPFAWGVKNENGFIELPDTTQNSKHTDIALRNWITAMNDADRRLFVNALFKIIEGSGAKKVPEFKKGFFKKLRGMKKAYKTLPEKERGMVKTGGKKLLKVWFKSLRKRGGE